MLTKNDLQEVKSLVKDEVETAVIQISGAVIKALEDTATKDDLKNFATKDDLKKVETRLGGVETRLGGVETRLDKVESRLGGVESRLDKVESRLGGVEEDLDEVKTDLKIVKRGIEILQKTTPNKFDFNDHEKRITRLEKVTFPTSN